jgi:hypothetical protein
MPKSLLTTANPKIAKGEKLGYLTAILHLAPADRSGTVNVCPHASDGCRAACLNTAGRGGIGLDSLELNSIQAARIRRTRLFKRDRVAFMSMLSDEIATHSKRARRHGLKPVVRLNGTSDLPFERLPGPSGTPLPDAFPDVRFYDYTKWPLNLRQTSERYHLTYSLSEHPLAEKRAGDALRSGVNVAVVFAVKRGGGLPDVYTLDGETVPVVDGDLSDLRFLDPRGSIVGLRAKGRAIGSDDGFVRAA